VHHILFYEYVEDILERRPPYRDAHLARIGAERDAGRVVMAGALGDPQPDDVGEVHEGEVGGRVGFKPTGAAIVFADGVAVGDIEAFADADPYVEAGLVTARRIETWQLV
jgi:uncharacterized protein